MWKQPGNVEILTYFTDVDSETQLLSDLPNTGSGCPRPDYWCEPLSLIVLPS